jgi:SAM-dependent methyltransferase
LTHITELLDWIRRVRFDNRRFWNSRYSTNMTLGSGPGSRGVYLETKKRLIRRLVDLNDVTSILDIGCGDIEILQGLELPKYTGIDISDVVIRRNRSLRSYWSFVCADIASNYIPEPADLVLCLDVLIHQKHPETYKTIISKAVKATKKIALFSGYSSEPPGWNVWFYEPLLSSLSRVSGNAQLTKLHTYRSTELWELRRGETG